MLVGMDADSLIGLIGWSGPTTACEAASRRTLIRDHPHVDEPEEVVDVARQTAKLSARASRPSAELAEDEQARGHAAGAPVPVRGLARDPRGGFAIQRKLTVGAANDPCEVEADQVAREVVSSLRGAAGQRRDDELAADDAHDGDAGKVVRVLRAHATPAAAPPEPVVGAAGGVVDPVVEELIQRARRGPGKPLEPAMKSTFEQKFDADLSGVRLHEGPDAGALSQRLQANAFTVGSDIFFRDGIPSAGSSRGMELVAHELWHTVQQGSSPRGAASGVQRMLAAPASVQRDDTTTAPAPAPAPTTSGPSPDAIEKALDLFAKRDGKSVKAAVDAYAKMTKESEEHDIGGGFTGSGKMDVGAQLGAYAGAEIRELADGYAVLAEAGLVAGASIKLEGELKRKFGPIAAKAKGAFSAFGGAMVKAFGSIEVGLRGIALEGSLKALAGATSTQSASVEFSVGDYGVGVDAEASEMAGAEFNAEGTLALKKTEIALGGQFSAFAGAKVEGSVKTSGKLYGREAMSLKMTASASAGVGTSGAGEFSIKRGVLRVKLGGALALGLGAGGKSELATDFKPIAVWIIRRAYRSYWAGQKAEAQSVLANPDSVKQDLIDDLEKYGAFKRQQLSLGKADNYVKVEKIQQYVNKHVPRAMVKKSKNAAAVDTMIKDAVETAFLEGGEKTVEVTVKDAKVKIDKAKKASEYSKKSSVVTSEKTGRGLGKIVNR